ncbi:HemK/PrmC family methyltransferase [Campylobacter upsaliensis]|nr:HemK/PrmC family methyltransferase [Campylobacter upsaliensis]EHB5118314.1 peptide chain release factor N(5)-glutamine methyltransferase [Campylobacter upsaliensis]CAG9470071.1 peptide chain release factor N(5)-glutamine methyltransferase [Campylobacter upsaliensis]HED8569815.1 peptide chain release factor N(5)-glutamine methyltransferase [Campylobacter upsaliensis]
MKIKEALSLAKIELKEKANEALFILCEFLQKDRTWLFLNENLEFDEREYFELIRRFKEGEPYEYLFKKADFYGLEFHIEKGVLIPRYDSEILLEKLLELTHKEKLQNALEIGFGSGILSIILAKNLGLKIKACDINEKALKIALKNAKKHEVLIDFVLSDFEKLELRKGEFDLIFSNPPYIKNSYPLDKWVKNEPKNALLGGEKGYEILEKIIIFAYQKEAKFLACEFGYDQKEILSQILDTYNFKAEFFKDENGFDRAFVAKRT